MKTVIDSTNVNALIVGDYYERAERAADADMNTPFDEKYEWIGDKENRMAKGKSFVSGVDIIITDPKRPNHPVQVRLSSFQVMYIAQWYNAVHDKICEPVEVDIFED